MPITLRGLSDSKIKKGMRVFVRVDWNVPLTASGFGDANKIDRTRGFIEDLRKKGAIVFLLTHLGRPKGRELKYSTQKLAKLVSAYWGMPIRFLDADLSTSAGAKAFTLATSAFAPGEIVLVENVRFQKGEETNAIVLSKRYAEAGDVFINDAFASCHRSHVSVVGLSKVLPSYAGPDLIAETKALDKLLLKPKKPFYAFIGGAKLSTKIPVIEKLLKVADKVFIGGAMAHPFFVAKRFKIGFSLIEKGSVTVARRLLKNSKIVLPEDVLVAKTIEKGASPRSSTLSEIEADEQIGDIGMETARLWSKDIRNANTIVWNGPFGVTEIPAFSHGSLIVGKAIALRAKGSCYAVAGGGDTLPVIDRTGMGEDIDFVSTGGGAMLEYIALNGKLPGILALKKK